MNADSRDQPATGRADANSEAVERAEIALQKGLAAITTPEDADRAMRALEKAAGRLREEDVAAVHEPCPPLEQAAKIEEVTERAPASQRAAAAIAETATQVAAAGPEGGEVLDRAIADTTGTPREGEPSVPQTPEVRSARRLLRKALLKRLKPLDAVDAALFLAVNDAPHPVRLNRAMEWFSYVMNAGMGWLAPIAFRAATRPRSAIRIAVDVLPPLWLATSAVEFPIKHFFRRRRPFISIVRAIVVGRRPGSYSFPSGHTAAAFAGALLLSPHFPKRRGILYSVASLVGFSRVYLGAHYPGDVVMGGLIGAGIAKVLRGIFRGITHAFRG